MIVVSLVAYFIQRNDEPNNIDKFTKTPMIFTVCVALSMFLMFLLMVLICSSNGIEENLVGTYLYENVAA